MSHSLRVITKPDRRETKERSSRPLSKAERLTKVHGVSNTLNENDDAQHYGVIAFKNDSNAVSYCHYVRLSQQTHYDDILKLLKNHWDIMQNDLEVICLSFVGSIDVTLLEKLYESLFTLILEVAKAKRLVIFCSGEDSNLTRTLGRALVRIRALLMLVQKEYKPPYLVGFLPWKIIKHPEKFTKQGETVSFDEGAEEGDGERSDQICPYLTHAFLVNERSGEQPFDCSTFRKELEFRMAQLLRGDIVRILVGGDTNTTLQIDRTFTVPLVVLQSSGGLADVFALAAIFRDETNNYQKFGQDQEEKLLKMLATLGRTNKYPLNRAYEALVDAMSPQGHILLHDLSQAKDITGTVLDALLASNSDEMYRLKFDVVWDKLEDFAHCLNTRRHPLGDEDISSLLLLALSTNRPSFIGQLAMFNLEKSLQVKLVHLRMLYNRGAGVDNLRIILRACGIKQNPEEGVDSVSENEVSDEDENAKDNEETRVTGVAAPKLHRRVSQSPIYLEEVYLLLKSIFAEMDIYAYKQDKVEIETADHLNGTVAEPLKHLFIWATVMDYPELARTLLRSSSNPTCMALIGSAIYDFSSKRIPSYNSEAKRHCAQQAEAFEEIACQIASGMHYQNRTIALDLVNVPHEFLLGTNLLWVCRSTSRVSFGVTPPVQTTASMDWHNGIDSSLPVFLLTLICPLLLAVDRLQSWAEGPMDNKECSIEKANLCERMKRFYNSAKAKHMLEFITYLAFLFLLTALLMLEETAPRISALESFVVVHYMIFCLMDVATFILHWHMSSWSTAFRSSKTTPFSPFNYFTYVVFWTWFLLRVIGFQDLYFVRGFMAFFLILCYVRIFDYLLVFKSFGPHILIMKPMLQEFSIFLTVIVIVLVPQAIALQRLSFPYVKNFSAKELLRILEYPYYNLFKKIYPGVLSGAHEDCDPNGIDCPLPNPMSNVLQVLYLFFAFVLLINLLIAVFSEVFKRLSPNSLDFWQFNRLIETQNYRRRPAVPKPYSIFYYAYKVCRICAARAFKRGGQDGTPYGQLSRVVVHDKSRIDFAESTVRAKVLQAEKAPATVLTSITEINNLLKSKATNLKFRMNQRAYAVRKERRKLKDSDQDPSCLHCLPSEKNNGLDKQQQLCQSVRNTRDAFTLLLTEVEALSEALNALTTSD